MDTACALRSDHCIMTNSYTIQHQNCSVHLHHVIFLNYDIHLTSNHTPSLLLYALGACLMLEASRIMQEG